MRKTITHSRLKAFIFSFLGLVLTWNTFAQSSTMTGKVTSAEEKSPLPGVNILIKGTNRGTTTDANGQFTLTLSPKDKILIVSSIGYRSQEITIEGRSQLNI